MQHIEDVKKVLQRLKDNDLYADLSKSEFHVTEVRFLGMIISTMGIQMDLAKLEVIHN